MATAKSGYVYEMLIRGVDVRSGQLILNVLHYRQRPQAPPVVFGSDIVGSDLNVFCENMKSAWSFRVMNKLSAHYQLLDITAKQIIGYDSGLREMKIVYGEQGVYSGIPGTDVGSEAGEALPAYCGISIQKKSSYAGKRFRGGFSVGPIIEANQSNGALTDLVISQWRTSMPLFLSDNVSNGAAPPGGDMGLVLFSKENFILADLPLTESDSYAVPIIALIPKQVLTSQVSRKPPQTTTINQAA